jgi:hypothetical protein
MILKISKDKQLVSWMDAIPKVHKYYDSSANKNIRTNDIRRVIAGERKTAGGFIWKEVKLD